MTVDSMADDPFIRETVSKVFGMPYLTSAKVVGLNRNQSSVITGLQIQVEQLIRDFPATAAQANKKPRKLQQSQLLSYSVSNGELRMTGKGLQQINDGETFRFRHCSPNFMWSVAGIMRPEKKPALQVWKGEAFVGEFDMSTYHGDYCLDNFFGWVCWDEAANHFIYQAEAKEQAEKTCWQQFVDSPSFGETLPTRRQPTVFVVDLNADCKVVAKLEPSDRFVPSQLIRSDQPGKIYFIGIKRIEAKRYGIAYCPNRPSSLCCWEYMGTEGEVAMLTDESRALNYPAYCSQSRQILFFGTYIGGSHYHAHSIYAYSLEQKNCSLLLDGEDESIPTNPGGPNLCGIFPMDCPQVSLPASNGTLFMTSYHRTQKLLVSFNPLEKSMSVHEATSGKTTEEQSWRLLQVWGDVVLAAVSSRIRPPQLAIGIIGSEGTVSWNVMHSPATSASQQVITVSDTIDIVLCAPTDPSQNQLPLIIFPHGGPNYSYVTEWSPWTSIAVSLGYAIAAINYTGSGGYGQASSIRALEGAIGRLDVDDCLLATNHLVEHYGFDAKKLYLFGGSHGGFLVAHLSSYPERFNWCAASVANGVIDLPSMLITSDISDFVFGQLGLPFDLARPHPPTPDQLMAMRAASASSRAHLVRAPTLVVLGENDLRVPPSQGRAWHTWLKGYGIEANLLCFPGTGHAIDSAEGEFFESQAVFAHFAAHPTPPSLLKLTYRQEPLH